MKADPPPDASSLFHHVDFRRLWIGDTGSQLGTALGYLAIPYLAVTALHANAFQMGLLGTVAGMGFLIIGLPAGALVDRRSKRRVMIVADICRGALLLTVTIAWWLHVLTFTQILVVASAVGVLTVFFDVSYQSYLPLLVSRDQVVDGNAKLQASQSVSQSAGPAVGGLLLKLIGPAVVIATNAAGYLVSAYFLGRIQHRETVSEPSSRRPLVTEIGEGFSFVVRHHLLRRLIACTGIINYASSGAGSLLVLYLVRDLHLAPLTIGALDSAAALGGLLGALLATRLARRIGEGPAILATSAVAAAAAFINPLASVLPAIPTLLIGGFAGMAAIVTYNIATVSFRQRLCPPELLGRMNATARFLVWGTMPLGSITAGVLGSHLGVLTTLWIMAATGCLALLPVVLSPLWTLRTLPAEDPTPPSGENLLPRSDKIRSEPEPRSADPFEVGER